MSRSFNDSLAADLEGVFLNTSEFAEAVTYQRGAESAASVPAIIASSEHELAGKEGLKTIVRSRDYRILVSDLILNSEEIEPRAGDRIRHASGDVYEVMKKPAAEKDSLGHLWVIHTAKVVDA